MMNREGSGSTTFTEIITKNTMYQSALFALNLLLMVATVVMVFTGYTLLTTYHFDKIYYPDSKLEAFWPMHALPWTLIGIGVSTLMVAILGFVVFSLQIRPLITIYAVLLAPLVLGKFGLIHITFKTETALREESSYLDIAEYQNAAMQLYHEKEDFRESWDLLQTHLRCCGGTYYLDYILSSYANQTYMCYPQSCCVEKNINGECILKNKDRVSFEANINV